MSQGRLVADASSAAPEPGKGSVTADLNEITVGAARAVARTLAAAGPLEEFIREAAERAVHAHLQATAKAALTAALEGDFGAALDEQVELALADALSGVEPEAQEPLVYENVADWVRDFLLPHYRRPVERGGPKWCPYWWEHTEAVSRLEATWLAWEHLRHEGATGSAVWWRDYFDPMIRELTAQDGPFHACKAALGEHLVPEMWTVVEPPDGLYNNGNDDDQFQED